MPPRRPSPIGAHVPITGGLARGALKYAVGIGAEALQIFVSNPRGWSAAGSDPRDDHAFREGCRGGHLPVFIHAPYLTNLGSPTPATLTKSAEALRFSLSRGEAIGATGIVVHAGSAISGARRDEALRQLRETLLPILDERPDGPSLLIEPTAGGGQALISRIEQLGEYFAALDAHPKLGVCLDTCHLYASGHDLAAPGGVRTALNLLVKTVGRGRLGLVHANDSRDPLGSRRDRHAAIGDGTIGLNPFRELFVHPATRNVPVIIETPGGHAGQRRDIQALRELRDN